MAGSAASSQPAKKRPATKAVAHQTTIRSTAKRVAKHSSDVTVNGYTKKNGKQVKTYKRTAADGTQKDNYSAKGNVNPYTGKVGAKKATR
jgi:hypothetical protein